MNGDPIGPETSPDGEVVAWLIDQGITRAVALRTAAEWPDAPLAAYETLLRECTTARDPLGAFIARIRDGGLPSAIERASRPRIICRTPVGGGTSPPPTRQPAPDPAQIAREQADREQRTLARDAVLAATDAEIERAMELIQPQSSAQARSWKDTIEQLGLRGGILGRRTLLRAVGELLLSPAARTTTPAEQRHELAEAR